MRAGRIRASAGRIGMVASAVALAGSAVACSSGGTPVKASSGTAASATPSATPSRSASATGRPVADDPCAAAKGKYHGKIIKVFPAEGMEAGKPPYHGGGALQVWRSTRCGTVWAKMVKSPDESRRVATDGGAGIFFPDYAHGDIDNETFSTSRWSYESRAFHLPPHTRFEAVGGYVGMYQYEAGGKLRS